MKNNPNLSAWGTSETQYFYELTPEKILQAVEQLGLSCTGRCIALNSMENRVYEVEIELDDENVAKTASERFRIVKFYRPGRWTEEQIKEEHQFLLDLKELEIPVVAPIGLSGGATLLKTEDSEIFCAIFPKVGGRNPDELQDEQLPIIGRLLARMHNVGAVKEAKHRLHISPKIYGRESLAFLQESKNIPRHLESQYADLVTEICDLSEPLFEKIVPQRVHGDCHLGNLLWGREGPFWVDFDDMLMGPCVQDLWLIIPGRDDYAKRQLSILLKAYCEMRDFDSTSLKLIEPLRALRMIHFSAWIAKRWKDPAFPRTFVDFGTEAYWQEQVAQLEEQVGFIHIGNSNSRAIYTYRE